MRTLGGQMAKSRGDSWIMSDQQASARGKDAESDASRQRYRVLVEISIEV